jgi:hypothetical protein
MLLVNEIAVMRFLSNSLTYIVMIIVAVAFVRRIRKDGMCSGGSRRFDIGNMTNTAAKGSVNLNNNRNMTTKTLQKNRNQVSLKQHNGMTLKDDRNSDWLARQLRDEARAMNNISDMFQLKQQHANKCDAEFIKRFHESNCDADGVDDGVSRR